MPQSRSERHRERQVFQLKLESEVQRERRCSTVEGAAGPTPSTSLSLAKFAVGWAGSGFRCRRRATGRARAPRFPATAGAAAQGHLGSAAVARAVRAATSPRTPDGPRADRGSSETLPLSLPPPPAPPPAASVTLLLGSAPINFLSGLDWDSNILSRPFAVCPLCPSRQCSCQQEPLVAGLGTLSVARSPESCWPVLPPEGVTVRIVPRTPAGLFPFLALWPLHLVKTSAKCAPGDEPSRRPPSARRGAGGSPDPCLRPPHPTPATLPRRPEPSHHRCPAVARPAPHRASPQPGSRAVRAAAARAWGAPAFPSRAGPCWACSVRLLEPGSPGAGISSPGFRGCRGGAEEGRLGDSQCLVPRPLPRAGLRPPAPQDAGQSGAGGGARPVTPSLWAYWELYQEIQFREERGEGEGERGRGEGREREHARQEGAPQSLRSTKEITDQEFFGQLSSRRAAGDQPSPQLWRLLQEVRDLSGIDIGEKWYAWCCGKYPRAEEVQRDVVCVCEIPEEPRPRG